MKISTLTIEMAANVARLRQDMDRARRTVESSTQSMARAATQARNALGAIGAGLSVQVIAASYLRAADAVSVLTNRLRLAHSTIQQQQAAYNGLYRQAQNSRVSFTELGTTYASIARNGGPQERILTVTGAIANAMTISGGSAQSMQAALVQLGQGMASGVLRGEELNSVMEQTPRLAKAIADGLGLTIGQLREAGKAGELTADAVTRALVSQADVLRNEVSSAALTAAQSYTVLGNAATNLVGRVDQTTGASGAWAGAVTSISRELDLLAETIQRTEEEGGSSFKQLANSMGVLVGRSAFGAVQTTANTLNWTINALTGNLLNLNENVRIMPTNLLAASEQTVIMNQKLEQARAEYTALSARLAQAPENIYIKSELNQLGLYIAKLEEAKRKQVDLQGQALQSGVGLDTRAEDARLGRYVATAQAADGLAALRTAYSGLRGSVADYTRDLNAAQAARANGLLTESAYVDLVGSIAKKYGEVTTAVRAKSGALTEAQQREKDYLETLAMDYQAQEENRTRLFNKRFEDEERLREAARELYAIQTKALTDSAASALQRATAMREESEAMALAEKLQISMAEAVELTTIARLEEKKIASLGSEEAVLAIQKEIDARKDLAKQIKDRDSVEAAKKQIETEEKAYLDMWKSIDETAKDVFTDVANEGEDAFERIGKTLKAAILDMLYQMTVRKWIFQIAGVDVGGMGGGGGGGGMLGNAQKAYSAYSNFSAGGGGNMGAAYGWANGTMSTANALGSVYANTMTSGMATGSIAQSGAGIDALLATNGAYGTAAAEVGAAAAVGAEAGAATGAASGLAAVPVWGWIALAVLALWEPMFGRKIREVGKAGNFDGAGGITTSQYTAKSGGWFRSDKTYYDPLNDGGAFQRQLKGVQDGMIETARIMGLGEDAIRNFAGSVNINLKGLNAEEAAAKTKEELTKLQAQMLASASYAPAVTQSLDEITQAMIEMGYTAEDAAAHAREVTARDDAMKRQGFESLTNYYIDLINQTEETMARAGITSQALADVITAGMTGRMDQSQVGAQLADIVLGGIYNTIAGGFAKQISDVFMQQIIQPIMMAVTAGVPLTTAISQQAMASVVAQAQQSAAVLKAIFDDPVFRQTMADLETTIKGIAGASVKPARSIRAYGSAALAAGDAAKRAAEEERRRAEEIKRAWQTISDSITEEIRRIRGEILGLTEAGQAYAQQQFVLATAKARAGDQEAARMLPQLSRALLQIAEETARSQGDLRAFQGWTLSSLEQTREILKQKYGLTIPGFANGGTHMGGWAMVGERGPELAYMPPAQIYTAGQTRGMLSGDDEMRREMRELKAANVAMAAILKRIETKQEQVSPGGVTRVQVVEA